MYIDNEYIMKSIKQKIQKARETENYPEDELYDDDGIRLFPGGYTYQNSKKLDDLSMVEKLGKKYNSKFSGSRFKRKLNTPLKENVNRDTKIDDMIAEVKSSLDKYNEYSNEDVEKHNIILSEVYHTLEDINKFLKHNTNEKY